ncbi:hypothetical protein DUNSADRAFT_1497 [Dunaliella salina]|uniref:JmjC domain-containing protein n=1 Tax=Dunaliella salina TaxID=3046 RepID=A0ABQ7FXC5_DUNSA|nr:hypothetical protein DUNSADRAFT_1497 [Dunaliella salina]|eukprot:KAF5827013.1 hypothetical protein DUNSADRAFT_1497 [Dunaliella salina]
MRLDAFVSYFSRTKFVFEKVPRGYKLGKDVFSVSHCSDFMSEHPGCMIPLYQYVGEVVHVPEGWLHAVFTLQPSVKMAWDFVELMLFAKYMAAWAHVGTLMQHTAPDYIGMSTVLVEHALRN